jgi:oxygen-independent coproporphyrinogen-3 oxidase
MQLFSLRLCAALGEGPMHTAIAKYFSARVPRYTSYPTAPHFSAEIDAGRYRSWLEGLEPGTELSLYLHVPFCRRMCWYCGCNMRVVARYSPVAAYTQTLIREIELVAKLLPKRMSVRHIHWGGGTPTALEPDDMLRVNDALRRHFDILPHAEIATELDPRTFTRASAETLQRIGCNRASLGVQELDAKVQAAINRVQPLNVVAETASLLREHGVAALNFDLMYGLPYQTAATLRASVEQTVALAPGRFALFGYAHVPWMAKNQRMLPEEALPTPLMRFEQSRAAGDALAQSGYERIGLDHFAKPSDSLAIAAREGRLHRNFQGYTADDATVLIAFGASSISAMPEGYVQNIVETGAYSRAILAGTLPVAKGLAFRGEDRLRAAIIERLMCDMAVDLDATAARFAPAAPNFTRELAALKSFEEEGLIERDGMHIRVMEAARPALRIVCAVFDTYLAQGAAPRHAVAV